MQSLWMLVASFVFAIMGVCVKLASATSSTSEIVLCRGAVGMALIYALVRLRGLSLRTALPWQHAWRGFVGVTALWLWFFAIGRLPLATAMTLNYMAPIWIAAIVFTVGWWHRTRRFDWGLTAAIVASFAGVALLLKPTIHADQWIGGLTALVSGFLSALAYLQVRKLGQLGEPEYRVVFYFSASGVLAGLISGLVDHWLQTGELQILHDLSATDAVLLLTIGVTATIAQIAMTRAYRYGAMLVTANLQYTGIVFSSLWGILIWGDRLDLAGWLGIAIILASGIAATFYNARSSKQ
ncbi:MAG: DMT family transporter [Burkholderiaceae bacterium]|nr:DMT family transporter [Burkholderiaceae bacterium]